LSIRLITLLLGLPGLVVGQQKYYSATNLWKVRIGHYYQSTPALGPNGVIYVTAWSGKLRAINPDGTSRWIFPFNADTVSSPAIGTDGTIYFGSRNRRIYAVTATGQQAWEFKTDGWVDASPAIGADGTVYCGSLDQKFYALTPAGQKKWEFATGGGISSSAAIDVAGNIYFGSSDYKFYALDAVGNKRWELATGGSIISSPAIGRDGEVYFSSTDGNLYALNPSGSRRWTLRTGGVSSSSPVLGSDGTIYLSVNTNHCAVSSEGKMLWRWSFWNLQQPHLFGESAAAVLADNTVVFTGRDGYVMTLPGDNGGREWLWNYWLYSPSYSSPLVAPDGTIYVMGLSPELNALDRRVPLAASPWPTARGNNQRTGRVATGPEI
jgi:outer membrane protein assembly factor BamB